MKITGQGKLLRIFAGESDHIHGRALYSALVTKARELGLAGATEAVEIIKYTHGGSET